MSESGASGGDIFELDRIRKLIDLMKEFDLRELDLKQADQQIRIARGGEVFVAPTVAPAAPHAASAPPPATAAAPAESSQIAFIRSPMVGTFYSRPNPKAEPFVKVGDYIEPDKTICIIEAMKVFNEIPAEGVRGRVLAVLVEDEEPVEFGKPLFKIDTAG